VRKETIKETTGNIFPEPQVTLTGRLKDSPHLAKLKKLDSIPNIFEI